MISLTWVELKNRAQTNSLPVHYAEFSGYYDVYLINGQLTYYCVISKSSPSNDDQTDFETNFKSGANGAVLNQSLPFASKKTSNGKRLFRRKHGYIFTLAANGTTTYIITVPYATCKINEADIVWCPEGVKVDMKVKDSTTGTYTGVPNFTLSQYGFGVVIPKDDFKDVSPYDADVFLNMQLEFTFTNSSAIEKQIGINMIFHEIV